MLLWVLEPSVWSSGVGMGKYSRFFTWGTLMIQRSWLGNGLNFLCSQREMLPWRAIQVTLVRFLLWITLCRSPSISINHTGNIGNLSCWCKCWTVVPEVRHYEKLPSMRSWNLVFFCWKYIRLHLLGKKIQKEFSIFFVALDFKTKSLSHFLKCST